MVGFTLKLELEDGTPAEPEPPTPHTAVPIWHPATRSRSARTRMLRVIEIGPGSDADDNPVLVVEHV